MVGVPRSSGCRICVQRRVRCDGAKPICNNCRKGNRPCPGYGPAVKFQDEGRKLREKYAKGQPQQPVQDTDDEFSLVFTPSTVSDPDPATPPRHWNVLGLDLNTPTAASRMNVLGFVEGKMGTYLDLSIYDIMWQESSMASSVTDQAGQFMPDPWSMIAQPLLSPESQQLQLLVKFKEALTPPEARYMPSPLRGNGAWLTRLVDMPNANNLLDAAIRAVTLVHVGILHKNERWMMESRPYYGQALRLLTNAITDKELGMDNRTLCATILLSFYEMFASDSDASWIRHAGGAGALMRLRGAKRHRYGLDRDVFLAYRHTLVIEAMSNDSPSFLDEPEWRQLSRDIYGDLLRNNMIPHERKGIYEISEEFYSQMAAISVTTSKGFHMDAQRKESGIVDLEEAQKIFQKLQSHRRALQNLFRRWQTVLKSLNFLPPLVPVDDPVVPFQYRYSNVFISSFHVGFWTTLMLVNTVLLPLATPLGKDTSTIVTESEECATEACRSVDFMLTSSFLGPFFAIYALRFSVRIYPPGDVRSDWAVCKLVEIGDRRMQFAKGGIGGGPNAQKPIEFYEAAKTRLEEFNLAHRSQPQNVEVS